MRRRLTGALAAAALLVGGAPLVAEATTSHTAAPRPAAVTTAAAATSAPPSLRYALLVGIKDYQGNTESTIGGAGDIAAVKRALIGAGWTQSHILIITENKATAAAIRNGITWLQQHSDRRTFSMFHYSGHVCIKGRGPCASGHTYLWSVDNKFIPETEVVSRMNKVQGHQWLDLSGCEGAAFDSSYHSATHMFSASSKASETSYEVPAWKESVYSGMTWDQAYIHGKGDPHGQTYHASIAQMVYYTQDNAPTYTAKQARGPQHPQLAGGARSWSLTAPPTG